MLRLHSSCIKNCATDVKSMYNKPTRLALVALPLDARYHDSCLHYQQDRKIFHPRNQTLFVSLGSTYQPQGEWKERKS